MQVLNVFGSLSLSFFGICSVGSNRTVCIICSFCTVHVSSPIPNASQLVSVQRMLCSMPVRLRSSSIVLRPATRGSESAYWRTGVGFASEVADQSGPERLAWRLSDSTFGCPRPVSRLTDACSPPDERIGCSIPHTGCSSEVPHWKSLRVRSTVRVGNVAAPTAGWLQPDRGLAGESAGCTCRNVPVTYVLLK